LGFQVAGKNCVVRGESINNLSESERGVFLTAATLNPNSSFEGREPCWVRPMAMFLAVTFAAPWEL